MLNGTWKPKTAPCCRPVSSDSLLLSQQACLAVSGAFGIKRQKPLPFITFGISVAPCSPSPSHPRVSSRLSPSALVSVVSRRPPPAPTRDQVAAHFSRGLLDHHVSNFEEPDRRWQLPRAEHQTRTWPGIAWGFGGNKEVNPKTRQICFCKPSRHQDWNMKGMGKLAMVAKGNILTTSYNYNFSHNPVQTYVVTRGAKTRDLTNCHGTNIPYGSNRTQICGPPLVS